MGGGGAVGAGESNWAITERTELSLFILIRLKTNGTNSNSTKSWGMQGEVSYTVNRLKTQTCKDSGR